MHGLTFCVLAVLSLLPPAYPQVLVTLFDSAGLTPLETRNLVRSLQQAFAEPGVAVSIVPCLLDNRRTGAPECKGTRAPNEVLIRIINAPPGSGRKPLGWTAVGPDGGGYVTLYVNTGRRHDPKTSFDPGILLGYAAAHELGHLLLRTPHHSYSGVMKAEWTRHEYAEMLAARLRFTPEESRLMRESLR